MKILATISAFVLILVFMLFFYIMINGYDLPPEDTSDLEPAITEVADEDNAYLNIKAAAESVIWPEDIDPDKLDDIVIERGLEIIQTNSDALIQLDEALKMNNFMSDRRSEGNQFPYTELKRINAVLSISIMKNIQAGNRAEALKSLNRMIQLSRKLSEEGNTDVGLLSGWVFLEKGLILINELLKKVDLNELELMEVLNLLPNPCDLDAACINNFKFNFQFLDIVLLQLSTGEIEIDPDNLMEIRSREDEFTEKKNIIGRFMIQPNRTRKQVAEFYRERIANVVLPCDERDLTLLNEFNRKSKEEKSYWTILRPNMLGQIVINLVETGKKEEKFCKIKLNLVTTRLKILTTLFEAQQGHAVESLSDLVPEYIDVIPLNPVTGAGMTLKEINEKIILS